MQWTKSSDGYEAVDDVYNAYGRNHAIDEFLNKVLEIIGNIYNYKDCPAIIFDLWSMERLLVFDSPYGSELNRAEKVYTQLTSTLFASYCEGYMDAIINTYGDDSSEYEIAQVTVENLTWQAVKKSISSGRAKEHLDKFDRKPTLIMISEGNDSYAHDITNGKRVEMLGRPIEPESIESCQCIYCSNSDSK